MASKYVPVKKEDTYALIQRAQQGDRQACEQIVSQNTGLVKNLALKFAGSGYELEDLLQIGFMGLLKAIERFDMSFDVMFSTYAVPMILGEIKRYIRDDGKLKVSRQMKMDIRNLKRIKEEYYYKNGTWPKPVSYTHLHSEHESGLAVDLAQRGAPPDLIRPSFPDSGVCRSFRKKAPWFGFIQRYEEGKEAITGIEMCIRDSPMVMAIFSKTWKRNIPRKPMASRAP